MMTAFGFMASRYLLRRVGCGAALAMTISVPAIARPPIDARALEELAARSRDSGSDAVVVYLDGKPIFDYHSRSKPEPLDLMSSTKSIVSLAVGEAIAEGKIKNIDEPVYDFFPEWKQGRKQQVTVRQLLSMTSGLQNNGTGGEVYDTPDTVKQALSAELATSPGARFSYNNKAMSLLAGIIHVATGQQIDAYVDSRFLKPMGIETWTWDKDDAGTPYAMADLCLLPEDFAKFGLLVTQRGRWRQGKQLVPATWIDKIGLQSQPDEPRYGLLWWRIPSMTEGQVTAHHLDDLAKAGVDKELLGRLRALTGTTVHSETEWHAILTKAVPNWNKILPIEGLIDSHGDDIVTWSYSGFDGIETVGYLGQYLVVFPDRGLVAVRQLKPFDGFEYNKNRFEDFADRVRALVPARTPS